MPTRSSPNGRLLGRTLKVSQDQARLALIAVVASVVLVVGVGSYHEDVVPSTANLAGTWEGPAGQLAVSGKHVTLTYPAPGNPVDSAYAVFEVLPSSTQTPIRLRFPHTVRPTQNGSYRVLDLATLNLLANGTFRQ